MIVQTVINHLIVVKYREVDLYKNNLKLWVLVPNILDFKINKIKVR